MDNTARKPYNSTQRSQPTKVLDMPAPDIYHHVVKNALIKDGWTITHNPFCEYDRGAYCSSCTRRLSRCLPYLRSAPGGDRHMDNLNHYRHILRELIQRYAQYQPACGEVQIEVIFDETNDHYELMYAGWNGPYRIRGSVLHIDIRQEKVWIQYDGTEDGIAEELVKAGIPHDRIVLAFKPPDIRAHTDFAVA